MHNILLMKLCYGGVIVVVVGRAAGRKEGTPPLSKNIGLGVSRAQPVCPRGDGRASSPERPISAHTHTHTPKI